LRVIRGDLQHERPALEQICTDFCTDLYTPEAFATAIQREREYTLESVPVKFNKDMTQQLQRPITKIELHGALQQMARGHNPGPDGVTVDFFIKFWDIIADDYLAMLQAAFQNGRLPLGMTSSAILLLFKAGDHANLSNWRPITLLNVSYKILAKVLQLRLQPLLKDIISTDQSAFLPGRFILDNILLQHETVDWAKESN